MKALFFFASLFVVSTANAQVGIGTTSPSTNAALDVSSTTKGLMLPRLNDTSTVSNPSAGLMIYSKQTQTPAYHNGTRWNTLAARSGAATAASGQDSITYTITIGNATNGFTNGTYGASTIVSKSTNTYTPARGSGRPTFENVVITKPVDANSIGFARALSNGMVVSVLEFKVFAAGATTPRYSIKLTGVHTLSYRVSLDKNAGLMDEVSFVADIYGYKNWLTNQSTAVDITRGIVPY